jgi:endoglucanase
MGLLGYSQCLPVTSTPAATARTGSTTTTTTATSTTSAPGSTTCSGTRTKFKYFGVNQSGAEFGTGKWPVSSIRLLLYFCCVDIDETLHQGVLGTDYIWPSPSSIDFFIDQGFNTFRIPFQQERLSPPAYGLTGAFDQTYLNGLKTVRYGKFQ